jgi:hypothetical protein
MTDRESGSVPYEGPIKTGIVLGSLLLPVAVHYGAGPVEAVAMLMGTALVLVFTLRATHT